MYEQFEYINTSLLFIYSFTHVFCTCFEITSFETISLDKVENNYHCMLSESGK